MKNLFLNVVGFFVNLWYSLVRLCTALPAETREHSIKRFPTSTANVTLPGATVLHTCDNLVGCNVEGDLVLRGKGIVVQSCRVSGDIIFFPRTRDCRVNGNAVYGDIMFEDPSDCEHNDWDNNTLVRRPANAEGNQGNDEEA